MSNISNNTKKIAVYIVLIAITMTVYGQMRHFGFVNFDDNIYITENSHVRSGISLKGILWSLSTQDTGLWNPLLWLSFMLDYELYGLNAGGYHVTNLILHILSTILLFWLFSRMTRQIWPSAFVAAFFALHPLHVESVAWVSERKDVLSAFFWMLTLCLYVSYTEKPVIKRYLLVLFSFVLALMSKPMVVTLPLIMILLDYWPLRRFESRQDNPFLWQLKEKLPFLFLSIIITLTTLFYSMEQENVSKSFSFISRLSNAPLAFLSYLTKSFWPKDMVIFYPFPSQIDLWQVTGTVLLTTVVTIAVMVVSKKLPFLFVGWFWYVITVLPVIGIIQISLYAMADHYAYLPSIGIAVTLGWGLPRFFKSKNVSKIVLSLAGIATVAVLSVLAWQQCGYWWQSIPLFEHTLKATKNNYIVHSHLGATLFSQGKIENALLHYNKAIQIKPDFADAYNNRGIAYGKLGQQQHAIQDYSTALRLKNNFADAYYNRGNAFISLKQYQSSIADLNKAISLNANASEYYNNRGFAYVQLGLQRQAIDNFNQAVRLNPNLADAYNNRGCAFFIQGEIASACADMKKACELGMCQTFKKANDHGYCR